MSVAIDTAGNYILPGGIDHVVNAAHKTRSKAVVARGQNCHDALTIDQHVSIDDASG